MLDNQGATVLLEWDEFFENKGWSQGRYPKEGQLLSEEAQYLTKTIGKSYNPKPNNLKIPFSNGGISCGFFWGKQNTDNK